MGDGSERAIETAVMGLLARRRRLVLAISGGIDSAVLLDAVARLRTDDHRILVASVDHGTGEAASEATARTVSTAARLGLPAISERLAPGRPAEAVWRAGRWAFLRRVAVAEDAPVVTAHTQDDHIETVFMRVLRGAGARGLAGLLARSPVERPFLEIRRAQVAEYASARGVSFVDDPSNASRAFLRNRVRLDLLPAVRDVAPQFEHDLLHLSREAAEVRVRLDELVPHFLVTPGPDAVLVMNSERLNELPDDSLRLLLPAILASRGIALDRRGLLRLTAVTRAARGTRGQISGGYEAVQTRAGTAILRPPLPERGTLRLRRTGETRFGSFRFVAEPNARIRSKHDGDDDPWRIYIPKSVEPVVRQWHDGDRLTIDLKGTRRRVKRFLADTGVAAPLRQGWPVVLCREDLVWIPGVRASQGAVRHEGPMVRYTCERIRD